MTRFNKAAVEQADEDGETYGRETIITCPYCGYENQDATWECSLEDRDAEERECGHCEKSFIVVCSVERTFKSVRVDQEVESTCND